MTDKAKALRQRLVARKSLEELRRARENAQRKGYWVEEDFEYAERFAEDFAKLLTSKIPKEEKKELFRKSML